MGVRLRPDNRDNEYASWLFNSLLEWFPFSFPFLVHRFICINLYCICCDNILNLDVQNADGLASNSFDGICRSLYWHEGLLFQQLIFGNFWLFL